MKKILGEIHVGTGARKVTSYNYYRSAEKSLGNFVKANLQD